MFFKKKNKNEEALRKLVALLDDIEITTQFIQDDDGLIRTHVLNITAGDKILSSNPIELQWPMQVMPLPEAFKGKVH